MLPTSIKSHVFTNLAWDNIDRLEEILTGKGTSHQVNGIAVQAKVYGLFLPTAELPHIEKKSKQRSVCAKIHDLEAYVSGARVGPQFLLTKNNLDKESCAALLACQKSLIWVLARQTDHAVPSWTGFNIQSRDEEPIVEDVIRRIFAHY